MRFTLDFYFECFLTMEKATQTDPHFGESSDASYPNKIHILLSLDSCGLKDSSLIINEMVFVRVYFIYQDQIFQFSKD